MENAERRVVVHLICEDDVLRERLSQLLRTEGHEVHAHESVPRFLEAVGPDSRGYVVAHVRLPNMTSIELMARMKARGVNLPVIVVAAHGDV